jgi:hypothetical protein
MITVGHLLLTAGLIASLVGYVLLLTAAFKHHTAWFLGSLLLPFVILLFALLHLRDTAVPLAIFLAGGMASTLGCHLAGILI